jgi:hypothetical protein
MYIFVVLSDEPSTDKENTTTDDPSTDEETSTTDEGDNTTKMYIHVFTQDQKKFMNVNFCRYVVWYTRKYTYSTNNFFFSAKILNPQKLNVVFLDQNRRNFTPQKLPVIQYLVFFLMFLDL